MIILEKVPKLEDYEGYLQWRRTMRDRLKMFELWTYLDDQATPPTGVSEAKVAAWRAGLRWGIGSFTPQHFDF